MSNIGEFYKSKNLFELKSKISSNQYLTTEQKELIEQIIDEMDLEEKVRLFPKTQAKIMARGNQQDAQSYNYSMNLDKNSINPEDRESIPAQKKARGRHARAAERYGRISRGEHPFRKSPNDSPSKWTNEEFDLLVDYLLDEGYTIEDVENMTDYELNEKIRLFPKTQAKIMARGNQQDAQDYNYSINLDRNSINPEDRESIPAQKKARGRHARAAERYGRIARGEHPFRKSPNDPKSNWTNEEFDLLVDYLLDEGYTVDDIDIMTEQDLMELSPKLLQRASQRATIKSIALKKKDPKAAEKANRQREKFRTAAQDERDKQELKSKISKMSDAQKRALKRKMSEEFSYDEMREALINHGYSETNVKYMNGVMLEQAFFQLLEAKNTSFQVLVNGKKIGKVFKNLSDAEGYAQDLWDRPKYEDAEILVVDANDYDDILWMNEE